MAVVPAQGTAENGTIFLQGDFPCQDNGEIVLCGCSAPYCCMPVMGRNNSRSCEPDSLVPLKSHAVC